MTWFWLWSFRTSKSCEIWHQHLLQVYSLTNVTGSKSYYYLAWQRCLDKIEDCEKCLTCFDPGSQKVSMSKLREPTKTCPPVRSGSVTHWVIALWDPSQISCQEAVSMVAVPLDRRMGVKDMKQLSIGRLGCILSSICYWRNENWPCLANFGNHTRDCHFSGLSHSGNGSFLRVYRCIWLSPTVPGHPSNNL